MGLQISREVSEKMKHIIRGWNMVVASISLEVWDQLEAIEANPLLGDLVQRPGIPDFRIHTFRIDRMPITKQVTVAYQDQRIDGETVIRVLDFVEGNA